MSCLLILLRGFLFPRFCGVCGNILIGVKETRYGLCENCQTAIDFIYFSTAGQKCILCGKPLITEIETCLSCRNGGQRSYDRMWVLFPYTGIYRKLLKDYKFAKNLCLADFFAEKVLEVIFSNPELKDAVIVPVPPRPSKVKDTGWDQVDYLVKRLKKLSKGRLKVSPCLKRRNSKTQKELKRAERIENLKGRILLCKQTPKTAIIIDDVITTGSTMEVCSQVLKEGGAEKVYGLCLFYD